MPTWNSVRTWLSRAFAAVASLVAILLLVRSRDRNRTAQQAQEALSQSTSAAQQTKTLADKDRELADLLHSLDSAPPLPVGELTREQLLARLRERGRIVDK